MGLVLTKRSLLLPEGWYPVRVSTAEAKEGPKGPYIQLELVVSSGEQIGRTIKFQNVSFSEKSAWRAIQFLEAVNNTTYAEGEDIPFDLETDVPDLMGMECAVQVLTETYRGKDGADTTRNSVVKYMPLSYLETLGQHEHPQGADSDTPF